MSPVPVTVPPATAPRARLVALGASNLTRLLPRLLAFERQRRGGPVEVLGAVGIGRSYGTASRFLLRTLPGIDDCGLWPALDAAPPLPTTAVVADVGNDVLYGQPVETIASWVDRALHRLRPRAEHLVVTGLPPELDRLGPVRWWLVRHVLVPGCRIDRDTGLRRAAELDAALRELSARHAATFATLPAPWFGPDRIHVRRRHHDDACRALLSLDAAPRPPGRWRDAVRPARWRAERRRVLGRDVLVRQPHVRLADGSTIALY